MNQRQLAWAALSLILCAFAAFTPAVLLEPAELLPFGNHLALLLAGLLAVASAIVTLVPLPRTAQVRS